MGNRARWELSNNIICVWDRSLAAASIDPGATTDEKLLFQSARKHRVFISNHTVREVYGPTMDTLLAASVIGSGYYLPPV